MKVLFAWRRKKLSSAPRSTEKVRATGEFSRVAYSRSAPGLLTYTYIHFVDGSCIRLSGKIKVPYGYGTKVVVLGSEGEGYRVKKIKKAGK